MDPPALDLATLLATQIKIIGALLYAPHILTKYIHYRGSDSIRLEGSLIPIPEIPFISYNDPTWCCFLNQGQGYNGDIKDNVRGSSSLSSLSESAQCHQSSIRPLGPGGRVGVPYLIDFKEGRSLVLKVSPIQTLRSEYQRYPPTDLKEIQDPNSISRSRCLSYLDLSQIQFIGSDEFTNETLIGYALNYIQAQHSIPALFLIHYVGAICGDEGLNLMENCDLGPLDQVVSQPGFQSQIESYQINDHGVLTNAALVKGPVIHQILTQIVVGLNILHIYLEFNSGDLKAGNIFLKSDPIDTVYDGIRLRAPFTVKIADYGKSSAMLLRPNGTALRFYNQNQYADFYLKFHPFVNHTAKIDGTYYYTIGSILPAQLYTRTRHMGLPFYRSFDYYTVLCSILTIPAFYFSFFGSPELIRTFWTPLWLGDEGSKALERIRFYVNAGTGRSIVDALAILRGHQLKCNGLELVLREIRADQNSSQI